MPDRAMPAMTEHSKTTWRIACCICTPPAGSAGTICCLVTAMLPCLQGRPSTRGTSPSTSAGTGEQQLCSAGFYSGRNQGCRCQPLLYHCWSPAPCWWHAPACWLKLLPACHTAQLTCVLPVAQLLVHRCTGTTGITIPSETMPTSSCRRTRTWQRRQLLLLPLRPPVGDVCNWAGSL